MPRSPVNLATEALFPGVSAGAVQQLLGLLEPLSAGPDTVIFTEREPGDSLFIVISGAVSLRCDTDADEVVELAQVGPADLFGELAVLSPAPRSATAITIGPVRALVLHRALFNALLVQRDPAAEALLRAITRRTCARLRQTDARIALLQDALRGASHRDLITRIEAVVTTAEPSAPLVDDETWNHRLATYLWRTEG